MKGRYCPAIVLTAVALLFTSIFGFPQNTGSLPKSSAEPGKKSVRRIRQLSEDNTYVVRQGDTLTRIARAFKTTPSELMSANTLRTTTIKIGQELRIPVLQPEEGVIEAAQIAESTSSSSHQTVSAPISSQEDLDKVADTDAEPMRQRLVKAGFEWIGVRYRRSGGSEKSGFDCSGLVKTLFSKFNIELPRSSREQFKQGNKIDKDKLEAGDLVFFSSGGKLPTHVGIYIGNGQFLHAARKARKVIISDLNKLWYAARYLGARRIMDLWWEEPSPATEN